MYLRTRALDAEVDGWDIRVGGVMDARSVWDLNRKDAMAHYTYD